MKKITVTEKIGVLVALLFLFNINAYAYLDPGSGSIFIQSLIAGIGMCCAFISRIREAIKHKLFQLKSLFVKEKPQEVKKENVKSVE